MNDRAAILWLLAHRMELIAIGLLLLFMILVFLLGLRKPHAAVPPPHFDPTQMNQRVKEDLTRDNDNWTL